MARKKSNKIIDVFLIFFSSIKTYFLYLDQCVKYLLFPIFGQLISLIILFTIVYYFNTNIDNIRNISAFFEDDKHLFVIYSLTLLPFLIVFIKAVYDYIIAFCALNLLFYTVSNKKKVKDIDFSANRKVIERKIINYVILMFLVTFLLIVPPLIFVAPIIWVFLSLSFQVLSFENDISGQRAISRSIELVKGNVIPTVILLLLCSIVTYWFLPSMFIWACEKLSLITFMIGRIETFVNLLSLDSLNELLSIINFKLDSLTIAKYMAENVVTLIVIAFTLPFRCCCFTQLYKLYDSEKIKDFSKESDEIIVRATGKKRKN